MKRIWIAVLVLLLFSACQRMYPDEYLSVAEHEAPFAYKVTTTETVPPTEATEPTLKKASRAYDIREAIQDMVDNGEESGEILVENYVGDLESDLKNMFNMILMDSPKYNYAMDRFDLSVEHTDAGDLVRVEMKLRLNPQEIQAIETKLWQKPALNDMYRALLQQLSSFTIQISGYQEGDFVALLEDYILHHPDQVVEAPKIYASVYPDKGNVRLVELHFVYESDRETLRARKEQSDAFFTLVISQISRYGSTQQIVETLYKHLVPRYGYIDSEKSTVYSQLMQKIGSSRTMASVVEYLCVRAGLECEIVVGERDGVPWYWNRIMEEGRWYHLDLHAAALSSEAPRLIPGAELVGYSWDLLLYPEAPEPEPSASEEQGGPEPEASESELPVPGSSEPEPAELSESTEPAETPSTVVTEPLTTSVTESAEPVPTETDSFEPVETELIPADTSEPSLPLQTELTEPEPTASETEAIGTVETN